MRLVDHDPAKTLGKPGPDLEGRAKRAFQNGQGFLADRVHVQKFWSEIALPRKDHQARGQVRAQFRCLKCVSDQLRLVPFANTHLQQLEIADDNCQQVVEIVRYSACHLTNRVQPLRAGERLFGYAAAAQVVQNGNEYRGTVELRTSHRQVDGDDVTIPMTRLKVAADADDPPLPRGDMVGHETVVALGHCLWHQHTDILADKAFGWVSEQVFGCAARPRDAALGIGNDYGVHGRIEQGIQEGRVGVLFRHSASPG